jgi:hypothetical protein
MRPVRRKDVEVAFRKADRLYTECKDVGALAFSLQDVTSLGEQINANHLAIRQCLGLVGILPRSLRAAYVWLSIRTRELSRRWGLDWYAFALIAAAPIAVLTFLASLGFTRAPFVMVFVAIVGLLIAYGFWSMCLLLPSSPDLHRATSIAERLKMLQARRRKLAGLAHLRHKYDDALFDYNEVLKRFESRKNRLLLVDWRSLRGVEFEDFLAEVFEVLGYEIKTTKASGDQGIDLIARKGERRIGIQAKGYEQSVGNAAVQEAFSGMVHYGCTECVVITNSGFTRGAYELAESTGCRLIDGERIPDVIMGKVY